MEWHGPEQDLVRELDLMLKERRVGLVAHYYMDPELQGTLSALQWPHVFVADSLAMGEAAVKMAATGEVDSVLCMGVDFMAESVRATLDSNQLKHVPVYRLAEQKIGCSLAEAAERQAYAAFLHQAAAVLKSLHVVYINTSLVTKAQAQETVSAWVRACAVCPLLSCPVLLAGRWIRAVSLSWAHSLTHS